VCRRFGVLTPEDPYAAWPGDPTCVIAPLFVLFDYTFRPDVVAPEDAVAWAWEDGIRSVDERFLAPDPYASRTAWCHARVAYSEERLAEACATTASILVNNYPLRQDLVRLYRISRFLPWCGTRRTEQWHTRFGARVIVSGYLHIRATDWVDGVRFEEVLLGDAKHWHRERGIDGYLRKILPGPATGRQTGGPEYHR
jgi:hypothetical protein